ncbi:MAG: 6-carboxytetrahydropterin synthase [Dysgonamonadaceae bacterium]|jgi:6-pyruvoyltetrahydropterin/6-carboxytetrahydropterin synthase|nr:6-carboxytetrahydropterin synthase [Dysgonamonadaceae bacterium]
MYKISKQFSFSASHVLDKLSDAHPCSRLHGHNYLVTVRFRSETLDEFGFVKDYKDLVAINDFLDREWDHRHLNEILPFHPTAENLARYLYDKFKPIYPELYCVEIQESPKTIAVYET